MPEWQDNKRPHQVYEDYARNVTKLAADLERLVARRPDDPILDLKNRLQAAEEQHGQMEAAYYNQSHLVKEEEADEHEKTFIDLDKAYATDIIYAWKQPGAVTVQAKLPSRILEDLKPKKVLPSGPLIERFRDWCNQYEAFMEQIKEAFKNQGAKVARTYFEGSIDAKLSFRLAALKSMKAKRK